MERMPDIAFRMMSFMFALRDIFPYVDKRIDAFGIRECFTVIDYGCGPERYLIKWDYYQFYLKIQ